MRFIHKYLFSKTIIILAIYMFLPSYAMSEKYMIVMGDTMPYKPQLRIENSDTFLLEPCITFEKINGSIINQHNKNCIPTGYWEKVNKDSSISKGNYINGHKDGIWVRYSKHGELICKTKYKYLIDESIILWDYEYQNSKVIKSFQQKWITLFVIDNFYYIITLWILLFVVRILLNSYLSNITIRSFLPFEKNQDTAVGNTFLIIFRFFWKIESKKEKYIAAIISNIMSTLFIAIFVITVIASVLIERY